MNNTLYNITDLNNTEWYLQDMLCHGRIALFRSVSV